MTESPRQTLAQYLEQRRAANERDGYRALCTTCLQSPMTCYCGDIRAFDPGFMFVILIHPHEARRRIATGRMSHLCLENSRLVTGEDFTNNTQVNALLKDPERHSVILYPGHDAIDLSKVAQDARASFVPSERRLTVFVIDGTWRTARKMLRLSSNLQALPRVCFTPSKPSAFQVRKQPAPECYSTIEAIHETIELLGPSQGFDLASRKHDELLRVFSTMVERQLTYTPEARTAFRP